jgi:lauroyl/myristoyl acyltransferase
VRARVAEAAQNIEQVRRLLPARYVPVVVRRRLDKLWTNADFRRVQEDQMRFLLEHTPRADEIPQLARAYAEQMMVRSFLRWHPRYITRQRVHGIERLTTERDPARSIILSFTHHHRYDGMFGSVARLGAPSQILITPEIARPEAGIAFAQHLRVAGRGGPIIEAVGGTSTIAELLRPGALVALAPDFPGHTPVTFLGRRVLGSFGTARLASMTNSQVVLVTHRRDEAGPYVQIEAPLEPSHYDDPGELLGEILRRHGEAILDWPEALESPRARFGALEE